MDDLLSKLNDLLSSKEGQQKIAEVSKLFSSADTKESAAAPSASGGLDLSALAPLLSSLGAPSTPAPAEQASPSAINDLINPAALASVVTALSKTNTASPETTLLLALKPFLKNQRSYRVDEAMKIMKLLALLPMIRQSGILDGIL